MTGDVIHVTLPVAGYEHVARLVTGGLASRLSFGFESVDDLQLAVEIVLRSLPARGETVTLSLIEDGGSFRIEIAPAGGLSLQRRLEPADADGAELGSSLERLVDTATLTGGPEPIVVLSKALPVRA